MNSNDATQLLDVIHAVTHDATPIAILYGTAQSETAGTTCMVQLDGSSASQSVKTLVKTRIDDRVVMTLANKRLTVIGVLGGVTFDGIIERSSNNTSQYIKYADGRMEAWGYITKTNIAVDELWGNMRCSQALTLNMVNGFHSVHYCSVYAHTKNLSATLYSGGAQPTTSTMGTFYLIRPDSATIPQVDFHYHVKGTWK